jgi:hypothetical protein
MRRTYRKILLPAILAVFFLSDNFNTIYAVGKTVTYASSERNGSFTVTLPSNWKQSILNENETTLYTYSGSSLAFFSIKVIKNNLNPVADIQRGEFLSLLEKDHRCIQILNTDDYVTFTGTKSRISVYEYIEPKSGKRSIIRTYFLRSGIFTYIFNCSAPIPAFYNNETAFSSILSSITFTTDSIKMKKTPAKGDTVSPKEPEKEESVLKIEDTSKTKEESTPQAETTDKKETEAVADDTQKENHPEVKNSAEPKTEKKEDTSADKKEVTTSEKTPPPYSSTTTIP